jgi:nucleoid DNA-binding protein
MKFEMTKSKAAELVDEVFGEIGASLTNGNEVTIHGFGKFFVTTRAAREGRNPQNGKPIQIKASRRVAFKMQKALKDAMNG